MRIILSAALGLLLAGCIPVPVAAPEPSNVQARVVLTESADRMTATAQAAETQVVDALATRQAGATATLDAAAAIERANAAAQQQADIAATRVALAERLQAVAGTQTAVPPALTATAVTLYIAQTRAENDRATSEALRLVFGGLALAAVALIVGAVWWLIGRMRADIGTRRAGAHKARYIPTDGGMFDAEAQTFISLLPAPAPTPAPAPPQDDSIDYFADWQRGYWMFARWLEILPREERTRDAMAGIVTAHGWNVYLAGLKQIDGALARDGKAYRLAMTPDEIRRACAPVIPPFHRASPTLAPQVRPVDAAYRSTVGTVVSATEPS